MVRPKKSEVEIEEAQSVFKKIRLEAQLSQEQIAREIGVSVSSIRRWEAGTTEPTMTFVQIKNFCKTVGKELIEMPDSFKIAR